MARAGRKDRGLLSKNDENGKIVGWIVRLYHEGRERRFGAFITKTEARDFYEKAKQEQKQGRFFPERYQHGGYALAESIIDDYMKGNSNKSRCNDKVFAEWWKDRLKGKRLNVISPALLEDAQRDLSKTTYVRQKGDEEKGIPAVIQTYSKQTVLHYLKFLRHVLNLAVRDGKLVRNPFAQIELPKVTTGRTRFLEPEEEAKVMKELGPVYANWARLSILTGLRKTEQCHLRWEDVDLKRGILTLPETKAGLQQYVELCDEAKSILAGMKAVAEAEAAANNRPLSPWVFPSKRLTTHIDPRNFSSRVFKPAVERSGIPHATWHALRHTMASRAAMNGASDFLIAKMLRHSSTALVKRYAHLRPGYLREAYNGISSFGKAEEGKPETVSKGAQSDQNPSPTVTETGKDKTQQQAATA